MAKHVDKRASNKNKANKKILFFACILLSVFGLLKQFISAPAAKSAHAFRPDGGVHVRFIFTGY